MTVRVYKSTDASAPVLTGQVGSLTALLDAILVNGYGAKAAAGWTINQTTTNKRGYLQNTTGANNPSGMLLYVDDTGPGAGAAREARVCGFETMSAITPTGTGQFPTSVQSLIGVGTLVIRKSSTADATARAWTCIANGQVIYLFIETGDQTSPFATTTFMFGDFKSFKSGDQWAVMIIGRTTENTGAANVDSLSFMQCSNAASNTLNTTSMGHFVARSWTGLGSSIKVAKAPPNYLSIGSTSGFDWIGHYNSETQLTAAQTNAAVIGMGTNRNTTLMWPTPNSPDGAVELEPIYITHSWCRRGYMLGLWYTLMDRPYGHGDTLTVAAGNLSGKSFIAQMIMCQIASTVDQGQAIIETSDTWS